MSRKDKKPAKRVYAEANDESSSKETRKKRKKNESKPKNKDKSEKAKIKPKNPFYRLEIESYVSIPPIYSGSPMKGVEYYLDTMILSYLPNIQGIMLAHRNCEFIDKAAKIYCESPFGFSWVRFEMLVWRVKRGDYLGKLYILKNVLFIE